MLEEASATDLDPEDLSATQTDVVHHEDGLQEITTQFSDADEAAL